MRSFDLNCARGVEPDEPHIPRLVQRSLMLVTALNPHIGYDKAAKIAEIAKRAHHDGLPLHHAAIASGYVSAEESDPWASPERMTALH